MEAGNYKILEIKTSNSLSIICSVPHLEKKERETIVRNLRGTHTFV